MVCKIYRDLIENANEYHRDQAFPKFVVVDVREQKELCCEQMRVVLENSYEFRSIVEPVLGIAWQYYDVERLEEMKFCPFCSAPIEYIQRKVWHYVEMEFRDWVLKEV